MKSFEENAVKFSNFKSFVKYKIILKTGKVM